MSDPEYIRHTLPIIFDIPAGLAQADQERMNDILNAVMTRMLNTITADTALQSLLEQHGIEWGWDQASWEQ